MFIGTVGEPEPENGFDGKIFLEKNAEERALQRVTYRNNFSHDRHINEQLKSGEWRVLYPDDPAFPMSDLRWLIVDIYGLDGDVKDLICLRYTTYSRNNGQAELKVMGDEDTLENKILWQQDGLDRELTIEDLDLFLRLPVGTIITEDINCDSDYML